MALPGKHPHQDELPKTTVPRPGLVGGTTSPDMVEISPTEADPLFQLLERAQEGDAPALEELLVRIQAPALAFLRRRLRDPRLEPFIEDVLAEVLIRVYRHHQKCRAQADREVVAWVLSIARNEALRLLERRPLQYGVLLGDRDPATVGRSASGSPMAPGRQAYHPVEEEPTRSRGLKVVLSILKEVEEEAQPELKRLLYLRLVEGHPWEDVGEAFGISASAAKRRFQRAQISLAKQVMRGIQKLPGSARRAALDFLGRAEDLGS